MPLRTKKQLMSIIIKSRDKEIRLLFFICQSRKTDHVQIAAGVPNCDITIGLKKSSVLYLFETEDMSLIIMQPYFLPYACVLRYHTFIY